VRRDHGHIPTKTTGLSGTDSTTVWGEGRRLPEKRGSDHVLEKIERGHLTKNQLLAVFRGGMNGARGGRGESTI